MRNSSPGPDTGLASRIAAFRSAPFRRYWLGSLGSVGATQLVVLGQGWLVFRLTGSPFDLGLLGMAASVPAIIMAFFGGVLADRIDKRRLLMATSASIAALLFLLAFLDYTGRVALGHVLVIAALIGLLTGIDWPARQAIFPALIQRSQMMSAVTLNSILWQGTRMAMPALGGVIITIGGTATVFLIATAGFIGMCFVLASLNIAHTTGPHGTSGAQLIEGIRFVLRTRLFAVLILLTWLLSFFGVSYLQLMPVYADLLGVAEQGYGALISASGVGSVTGTLLVGVFFGARRFARVMLAFVALAAIGLCLFGVIVSFASALPAVFHVALVCVFFIHLFVSAYLVASMTVLQLNVPDTLRGRVMGIHGINFSLIQLGAILGGSIAAAFGAPAAMFTGAAIISLVVLVITLTPSMVRSLDGRT